MERFYQLALAIGVLACGAAGCDRGPQMCVVTGNVSYQGQPVQQGEILFADVNKQAPTGAGRIELGKYTLKVSPGKKTVRVTATRATGKMLKGAMGVERAERVDIIPPQYNTATELERTIEPQDAMTLDFQLE